MNSIHSINFIDIFILFKLRALDSTTRFVGWLFFFFCLLVAVRFSVFTGGFCSTAPAEMLVIAFYIIAQPLCTQRW